MNWKRNLLTLIELIIFTAICYGVHLYTSYLGGHL